MVLLPQRLFDDPNVTVALRQGDECVLRKRLDANTVEREGYLSLHAITLVRSGEQRLRTFSGEHIAIRAGGAAVLPRGMYAVTDLVAEGGGFETALFYFDSETVDAFLSTLPRRPEATARIAPSHLKLSAPAQVGSFLDGLFDAYRGNAFRNRGLTRLKTLELLHLLDALAPRKGLAAFLAGMALPERRDVAAFMESHFDKPLKVEDYAYLTGRSLSAFRRDFKARFGLTPARWLKEKRLSKAMALADRSEVSVTELAFAAGYENVSYFIKEFKGRAGVSPKQYLLSRHRNRLTG